MHPAACRPRPLRAVITLGLMALLVTTFAAPGLLLRPAIAASLAAGLPAQRFDGSSLPAGWTVLPASGPGWTFDDPGQRGNNTSGTAGFAIADSDDAGRVLMDTELRSPAFSLSGVASAALTFANDFAAYEDSTADVDYSSDAGRTWTNLWRTTADTRGKISLALPAAALGKPSVILRFHYSKANFANYWQLDDIQVLAQTPPTAPGSLKATASGSQISLRWTDASSNETGFRVERSPSGAAPWTTLTTTGPNIVQYANTPLPCATAYSYRVSAVNGAGVTPSASSVRAATPACVAVSQLSEAFSAPTAPQGWSVKNVGANGWSFTNPGRRTNETSGAGTFAIADSDTFNSAPMTSELRTPTLNFASTRGVQLSLKTYFRSYETSTADIDISSDGGTTWSNVWRRTADFKGPLTLDISTKAAGKTAVLVRFRYYNADNAYYWQIDDVAIGALPAPATPTGLTTTLDAISNVLVSWKATSVGQYQVQRAASGSTAWATIATLGGNVATYIDKAVQSNTSYSYRLIARNSVGASAPSAAVTVKTGNHNQRVIDLTVSYYDTRANTAAKRVAIENNIRYMADAIYEMSNGAHLIGKVTIYTDARMADRADILWTDQWYENEECWPNAHTNGYRMKGSRIQFCDTYDRVNVFYDQDGPIAGGYGLAHEMGHYFYAMKDEYKGSTASTAQGSPWPTDKPVQNSVMNWQWGATPGRGGNMNWLNFSTPLNITNQTAQHRIYQASAWTTLVRPPAQDPETGRLINGRPRLSYPELASVAPAAGKAPSIQLPAGQAAARSKLKIVWDGGAPGLARLEAFGDGDSIIQLVVDNAAGVSASQLADIKAALRELLNRAALGDGIGLLTYADSVTSVLPILKLSSEADRATINAAIDGLALSTSTARVTGTALEQALAALTAQPADINRGVYLFAGDISSAGPAPLSLAPAFQEQDIAVFTFGLTEAAAADLRTLAIQTTGLYQNVASLAQLRAAINIALQQSQAATIASLVETTLTTGSTPQTFTVDATLGQLEVMAAFYGVAADAQLVVTRPGGQQDSVPCADANVGTDRDAEVWCSLLLPAPAAGQWQLSATAAGSPVDLSVWVDGTAKAGAITFDGNVDTGADAVVTYPQPVVIEASVGKTTTITDLAVTATVETPDGEQEELTFRDDGEGPDGQARDGLYAALLNYRGDGDYGVSVTFDNSANTGIYTEAALSMGIGPNGEIRAPEETPVNEVFQRVAWGVVTVEGWQDDDHADDEAGATALTVGGAGVRGQIDVADDLDMFSVTVPADYTGNVTLTVSQLGLEMDPYVYVSAADGSWEQEGYFDYIATSDDYLVLSLPAKPGQTFSVAVLHYDETATQGIYQVRVGAPEIAATASKLKSLEQLFLPIIQR